MNFEKFKKFVVNNYKILIPIVLLLVVFLGFIIYFIVSRTFPFSEVEVSSYYQYFGDEKVVYDAEVTKDRKGVITEINPVGKYIQYDSTPIYDSSSDVVIFPSDMSVVAPILNCSEYLAKSYSYIKYENKRYSLITENYNQYLGHYFFYDGEDLYFFIEDFTLVVGDERVELGPFSYVIAKDDEIVYYNREKDELKSIEKSTLDVYVENDYYKIYIGADYIDYSGQRVILTSDLSYLSTIDEMRRATDE